MDNQQSGSLALASIALQLTLMDTLVRKGVLEPDEVKELLLAVDAKVGEGSPTTDVTKGFLAELLRDLQLAD
ncbi:MAG: hypothetical protein P0Y52_08385 [Candidatus Brevundimonas phytovorans]|nr:hypothetical protein [Brevundimonas sp.]WEK56568.1 MAG: hypothetical protein P0Y52_08385 [Brevundimonas sp.]